MNLIGRYIGKALRQFLRELLKPISVRDVDFNLKGRM